MKLIQNGPDILVQEMKKGIVAAGTGSIVSLPEVQAIACTRQNQNLVKVVSGGGSGYEPLYAGLCGAGMADVMMIGNIDAAPSAYAIYKAVIQTGAPKGAVFVHGNYMGDFLNYDMAIELLAQQGVQSASIIVRDAIYSDLESKENRTGIAGIVWAIKMVAAAAEMGKPFQETLRLGQKAVDNLYTVAFLVEDAPHCPGKQQLNFGKGVSGELGELVIPMKPAKEIAGMIYHKLKSEMLLQAGDTIGVMLNSYSATSFMELMVLFHTIDELALADEVSIYHVDTGHFYCLDGEAGCSITFIGLEEELLPLMDRGADSAGYKKMGDLSLGNY